ncbi:phospholipase D-like domain-containing protein [Pseudomonas sp. PSKL.D1]|uniref:phospholipase D-like domain-containing protein n=1 Tax=Pseudomonas sp. PSKL.D1 TaxID=3029060 RepID=UPI0023815EC2|nr:phospholipase [Pseudomonas sp. PSKL.D1]WDY60169.1 phospholipase [Pseudomonas sp. PSKL.D1]
MISSEAVVAIVPSQDTECMLTPPWFVERTEYDPALTRYTPLVNGEETFRAVHLALTNAKKSIDIICWGFQPSMYLIRDGSAPCLGELLLAKAREGVQVRILGWEMPFNLAGFGGEGNLPGKGLLRLKDRAMQSSTEAQYAFDREWFQLCEADDDKAAARVVSGIPVFVSRGFSWSERAEIDHHLKRLNLGPHVSPSVRKTLRASVTHHQKSVLVDYELPDHAVGFVMGHNLLDEYWDTDDHSALNRGLNTKPAPDRGARGDLPRQDISSQISGPVLEHLHKNFATAWHRETGEDLLETRQAKAVAKALHLKSGSGQRLMSQLLRTQAQEGSFEIEPLYLQAVNNATQFIYIENQYFRWPPLAEAIKKAAVDQTCAGREPGKHGVLHLFVVTNATKDGVGAGTVNTQRMMASLGRANTMPNVTKQLRIKQLKKDAPPRPRLDSANDHMGRRAQAKWDTALNLQIKEIEEEELRPEEIPGLKVHVCSLVAPDSPAGLPWVPVYVHSKLMIVNDVFTTHGSANINTRSMRGDSELNIAHEWASETQKLRRRLWGLHTNKKGVQDDAKEAFEAWRKIMDKQKDFEKEGMSPKASIVEFYYAEAAIRDLD